MRTTRKLVAAASLTLLAACGSDPVSVAPPSGHSREVRDHREGSEGPVTPTEGDALSGDRECGLGWCGSGT